jgi:hypothetical protein
MVVQETRQHATPSRSIAQLLRDLRDELARLFRQEILLARSEVAEQTSRAGRNLGKLVVGGLVAYAGLLMLLVACAIAVRSGLLAAGLAPWLALALGFLVTGAIVGAIGYVLVQACVKELGTTSLVPRQTVESLRENKEWVKEKVS